MKSTRYVLFAIGLLGLIASGYNLSQGEPFTDSLVTIICSASLVFGAWQLGKEAEKES